MRGSADSMSTEGAVAVHGDRALSRRRSRMALAAVGLVVVAVLSGGCTPGSGGKVIKPTSGSDPKLGKPEGISAAATTLANLMDETRPIGDKNGVTGWEVVGVIDRVESSVATITDDVKVAETFYSKTSSSSESKEALKRLTALRQAINKCKEALVLERIVAVGDIAVGQANAGVESVGNAIDLANGEEHSRALSSAKDAKKKLAAAQQMFSQLAAQYPGAGFEHDVAYCKSAVKYADSAVRLAELGKGGSITSYNKLVDTANAQLDALNKMTNPVDRWNKISADSAAAYNASIDALEALSKQNSQVRASGESTRA